MPNVRQIITAHNKTILDKQTKASKNPTKECNCRYKESCLLQGKCQTESVVYQATVTRKDNQQKETYVGHINQQLASLAEEEFTELTTMQDKEATKMRLKGFLRIS